MITFHIISILPESLHSYLKVGILGRAIRANKIKVKFYNPRDFTKDKHRTVDDKTYGGGPGMVMKAEPIIKAVNQAKRNKKNVKIFVFTPAGKQFTNIQAKTLVKKQAHLIFICGRYEGIDARVKKIFPVEEISIGPYILSGGELPALIVIDAVARQVPGVLGKLESIEESRIASSEVYTRPECFKYRNKKYQIPKVLSSGDHQQIVNWRLRHNRQD